MSKVFNMILEITLEAIHNFAYFIKSNLINFANILNALVPYIMYFVGQYVAINRDGIAFGGEIFIPFAFAIIIHYLKSMANKVGKGITVPLPDKRFTQVDEDGEVSVEQKRIQELILYTADLEDWMERKGLL